MEGKKAKITKKSRRFNKKRWVNSPDWFKERGFKKKRQEGITKATKIRREVGRWLSLKGILKDLKPPFIDFPPPLEDLLDKGVLYVVFSHGMDRQRRVINYWNISDYLVSSPNADNYNSEEFQQAVAQMVEEVASWIEEKEMEGYTLEDTNLNEWKTKIRKESK